MRWLAPVLGLWVVPALASAGGASAAPETAVVRTPVPPAIVLTEELTDRNPTAFARRLGELIGVEVRLPVKGFRKLSVPAGEWTATHLLNHVASQIEGSAWQQVYELRTVIKARSAAIALRSKLPSSGKVTLHGGELTYSRVVEKVQEAAPCVIRLLDGTPPGRFRVAWSDTPLEIVLADLASAGGLRVTQAVILQREEEVQAEASRSEEERHTRETLQQSEIANRLQELYGADATSEDFPWDTIDREALSRSLGRELDLDAVEVETLMERLRLEGLTQRSE